MLPLYVRQCDIWSPTTSLSHYILLALPSVCGCWWNAKLPPPPSHSQFNLSNNNPCPIYPPTHCIPAIILITPGSLSLFLLYFVSLPPNSFITRGALTVTVGYMNRRQGRCRSTSRCTISTCIFHRERKYRQHANIVHT